MRMPKTAKIILLYVLLLLTLLLSIVFTSEYVLNYLFKDLSNVMTWLYLIIFEVTFVLILGVVINLMLYFKFKKKEILYKRKGYLINTYITLGLFLLPLFLICILSKNK